MAQVPPSPILPIEEEKTSKTHESKTDIETGVTSVVEDEKDLSSSDGDDALKLAGTHARHFDEKYYARLRRKIVSHIAVLQDSQLQLTSFFRTSMSCPSSYSCTSPNS